MLKRNVIVNLVWLMVSVGMLVAGSHLGRRAGGSSEPEEVRIPASRSAVLESGGTDQERPYIPLPGSLSKEEGALAERGPSRTSEVSRTRSRELQAARRSMARASFEALQRRGPLNKKQISGLVVQAVRASSPVERRRAFDRILEEMSSPTFTREQAFLMRAEMARNGADGRLWQLWDYAWGASDPVNAVAHLAEIDPRHFEGFLGNMIPGLASVDPQAAIEVFSALEPEVASRVERRLLEGLVDNDVMVATDFIFETTDLTNFDWRPMDTLTREIARDSGMVETLEWASELPDGPLRSSAWSAAYAAWGSKNPEGAIESIMAMNSSNDRNMALNGFTAAFAHTDGSLAVEWANEITAPQLREAALMRAFRQFHRQNPQAAAQSFAANDLPSKVWQEATGEAWSGVDADGRGGSNTTGAGARNPAVN